MAFHAQYRALVAAVALALWAGAAPACRLALVLALDVSSSVDAQEDALQRQGLAAALIAPRVMAAVLASPEPVELYVFEWSGQESQVALLPGWTTLATEADIRSAAAAIAGSRRSRDNLPTALGRALAHAADLLRDGPVCHQRTIDVSGDGENNESFDPVMAYDVFPFAGVTVNALVVLGQGDDLALLSYFRAQVLHGPGAFLIGAAGYADYRTAMEAKLIRELALPALSAVPGIPPDPRS